MNSAPSTVRGALWMGGAVLSFSVMAIAARELLRHMGTFEILFFRTFLSLALVLPLAMRAGMGTLRTRRFGTHLWRNLFHFGGQAAWVYSIGALPLAMVFALEFSMPVWVAILAVLFLGERLDAGRLVMLALGMAGVLVILRPGTGIVQPAALVMLAGALGFAVQMIGTKRLSSTDSPLCVLRSVSIAVISERSCSVRRERGSRKKSARTVGSRSRPATRAGLGPPSSKGAAIGHSTGVIGLGCIQPRLTRRQLVGVRWLRCWTTKKLAAA